MTRFRSATRSQVIEPANCSGLSKPLTLTAMGLGWGLVQLDVSIVNTALESIGTSLGGRCIGTAMGGQHLHGRLRIANIDDWRLGGSLRCEKNLHDWLCPIHGRFADFWTGANIRNPDYSPRSAGRWRGDHGAKLAGTAQPRLSRAQSTRPRRRLVGGGANGRNGRFDPHLSAVPESSPWRPIGSQASPSVGS